MFAFTAEPVHGLTAMLISVPSPGSAALPLVPVVPVSPPSPDPASEHAAAIRPSAITSSRIRHHFDSRVLIRPLLSPSRHTVCDIARAFANSFRRIPSSTPIACVIRSRTIASNTMAVPASKPSAIWPLVNP